MIDIVFNRDNEEGFIQMAEKLRFDSLYFANKINDERLSELQKKTKIRLYAGCLKLFFGEGSEKSNIRHALEKTDTDVVYGMESHRERDFMHQRNSGFNHILCGIAVKRNKIIAVSFGMLLNTDSDRYNKMPQILGRMKQNARLCRKYKVRLCIASFADDPYKMRGVSDLTSFGVVLGLNEGEAKRALSSAEDLIRQKILKARGEFMPEGIERV